MKKVLLILLAIGLIGGFFAYKFGYHLLFIVDGITCFAALIVLFYVLGHRNESYDAEKQKVKTKKSPYGDLVLMAFLFFNLLNMIAFFQILFSVPVYFKEVVMMDEWLIGAFFTANGLLVFLLEMPLVYQIEQSNKYFRPMAWGAVLIGLGYLSLMVFGNPLIAIILYSLLVAVGEVINFPLIPSLSMRRADEDNQGKYMGVVSMMFAMAFMLAPVSGLPVIEYVGYQNYWLIATSFSLVSGICLWWMRRYFKSA